MVEFVLQVSYLKCVLSVAVFSNIMMGGTYRELYYNTEIKANFLRHSDHVEGV
jgi:hypothetical protein